MDAVRHRIHEAYKNAVESVTTVRNISAFKEKGVLTPDEFVTAGDNLVQMCPTWSWESGDSSRLKSYLPKEKQLLVTRNVPCLKRYASVEAEIDAGNEELLLEADGEEGWVAPSASSSSEAIPTPTMEGEVNHRESFGAKVDHRTEDNDIPDMEDFDEDVALEDDPATLEPGYLTAHEPEDGNILRTRTYDITITYDKYYQTPRIWLFGYDEYRQSLAPEQVFDDVSQDHARKTVTIDDHPNLPGKFASVHPCRHSHVMKKIVGELCRRGVEPRVDQYLFIFLKFIASIVPTIEYDYTLGFDLGPLVES